MLLSVQIKNTQEVKNECFLIDKTMCKLSAYVAFDKATNGQTDIKHKLGKTLGSLSLLKIVCDRSFSLSSFPNSIFEREGAFHLRSSTVTLTILNSDIELSVFPIS